MTTLLAALEARLEELACHDASCAPPPVGTGGSKPSSSKMADIGAKMAMEQRRIQSLDQYSGSGATALVRSADQIDKQGLRGEYQEAAKVLKDGLNSGELDVRVRIPSDVAEQILIADNGTLKTQRETGTSSGVFDPDMRDLAEQTMFGVDNVDPIYGYMGGFPDSGFVNMYGEVSLVMKPEVNERTTLTIGDSLFDTPPPMELSDLQAGGVGVEDRLAAASPFLPDGAGVITGRADMGRVGYIETQIRGGVTRDDIAKVIVRESLYTVGLASKFAAAGYEVEVHPYEEHPNSFSLMAALERRIEELACHDASCAPPPVGTGGSKPSSGPAKGRLSPTAEGRVKPEPIADTWRGVKRAFGGNKEFLKKVEEAYTVDLSEQGLTMQLDRISEYGEDVLVQMSLRDADGRQMGRLSRNIGMDYDGTIVATHDIFSIRPEYRGMGIAQKVNDSAMKFYEEMGVDRIELEAALGVGPYAWARQGYRYDGRSASGLDRHEWVSDRISVMRQMVAAAEGSGRVTTRQANEMKQTLTQLRNASARGEDVQPIHIASVGENTAFRNGNMWLGKRALMDPQFQQAGHTPDHNRTWNGTYYLGRESQLTAALARRMEELACHSKACAPPPVGTGGSNPGGPTSVTQLNQKFLQGTPVSDAQFEKLHKRMNDARRIFRKAAANTGASQEMADELNDSLRAFDEAYMNQMTFTTPGGRSFDIHVDTSVPWDPELVQATVERYSQLVDEYVFDPVPLTFGPSASATVWTDDMGLDYIAAKHHANQFDNANGYVVRNTVTDRPVLLNITGSTAAENIYLNEWSREGFNENLWGATPRERALHTVTHETGHVMHFQTANNRDISLNRLNVEQGISEAFMLRESPHVGNYGYSTTEEFAAEAFAINYSGWDGGDLRPVLDWAYDRKR